MKHLFTAHAGPHITVVWIENPLAGDGRFYEVMWNTNIPDHADLYIGDAIRFFSVGADHPQLPSVTMHPQEDGEQSDYYFHSRLHLAHGFTEAYLLEHAETLFTEALLL